MALFIVALIMTSFSLMMQCDAGVYYTRWGRSMCPESSTLVYSGYSACSHWSRNGGGSNYICLPSKPQFNSIVPGIQADSSVIYGVEYRLYNGYSNGRPFSYENNYGDDLHGNDAPCAVCYNKVAFAKLMIPGLERCPMRNMQLAYKGYLVSERSHPLHHRSQFVCLDGEPAVVMGGQASRVEALFYPVEVTCGSLPCPPYGEGKELTCVVCTSS